MTAPLINQSLLAVEVVGEILGRNAKASRTWSAGGAGYERISRQIADAIAHTIDRLAPRAGARILDVATGTGLAARLTQARGAAVTGIDFGPDVIAAARKLDGSGAIDFRLGDAEFIEAAALGALEAAEAAGSVPGIPGRVRPGRHRRRRSAGKQQRQDEKPIA